MYYFLQVSPDALMQSITKGGNMAYKHMNKIFEFQLPSTTRFVLLALARYADSNGDCFPGIAKLSYNTGFNEKTIVRSIRVLARLGIIDVHKNPKGPNHTYTVHLTGDIEAWKEYLESKQDDIKAMIKENQSASLTTKSIYNNNLKDKVEIEVEDMSLLALDKSNAVKPTHQNLKNTVGKNLSDLPPGKRVSSLQEKWEEVVAKYFKGLDVVVTGNDKWEMEDFYKRLGKEMPLYDFIDYSVSNWGKLANYIKDKNKYDHLVKFIKPIPDFSLLSYFSNDAWEYFLKSEKQGFL